MTDLLTFPALAALVTLTGLEIVLGIDNVIFIAILVGKLPPEQRIRTRNLGLFFAMFLRIALLLCLTWIMGLTKPLFAILGHGFTGKDLILLAGGLFLLVKSTREIHEHTEDRPHAHDPKPNAGRAVIGQIIAIDLVFSLDSIITAVGMAQQVAIMIAAVVLAVLAMMAFSGAVSAFIERHPTIKMLALSFLLMIGVMLVADGLGYHIERGYIYFAMTFSLFVEMLNIRARRRREAREAPQRTSGPESHTS
jgi:predicted tellurium resistance membrane protein TerC